MKLYSVEHRKKLAKKYNLDEQEVINLPIDKLEMLETGLAIGEKYGARKIISYLKNEMERHDGGSDEKT